MYYYDPNNDKSNARRWASLAALLYALSIAAAFLFVSFDMGRDELLPGEGLLIDFGTTETGLGDRDLSATDVQAPPQQAAAEASRQQVEYVTSEREEIAVQTPQPEKKPRERETPGQTPQRSDAQQPAEHGSRGQRHDPGRIKTLSHPRKRLHHDLLIEEKEKRLHDGSEHNIPSPAPFAIRKSPRMNK